MNNDQCFLAKALYDNVAESPDELTFRRGDVLTVLEQNTGGLEGWWLCTLNGRQGIAPGNRMKLITGMKRPDLAKRSVPPFSEPSSVGKDNRNLGKSSKSPRSIEKDDILDYDTPRRQIDSPDYDSPSNRYPAQSSSLDYDSPHNVRSHPTEPSSHNSPLMKAGFSDKLIDQSDLPDYDTPSCRNSIQSDSLDYEIPSSARNHSVPDYDQPCNPRLQSDLFNYDSPSPIKPHNSQNESYGSRENDQLDDSHLYLDYDSPVRYIPGVADRDRSLFITKNLGEGRDSGFEQDTNASLGHLMSRSSLCDYDIVTSSADLQEDYDVPLRDDVNKSSRSSVRDSLLSNYSDYSSDPRLSLSVIELIDVDSIAYPELIISRSEASEKLAKLKQEFKHSVADLQSKINSTWRRRDVLHKTAVDIRRSCENITSSLKNFVEFSQGAVSNATKASDKNLSKKLFALVQPLSILYENIRQAASMLHLVNWDVAYLEEVHSGKRTDQLGDIISSSRDALKDVSKITSMIQGNSILIFGRDLVDGDNSSTSISQRQQRPLPVPPHKTALTGDKSKQHDYDDIYEDNYVQLSSLANENGENLAYTEISPRITLPSKSSTMYLQENDSRLVNFYDKKIEACCSSLDDVIDSFFLCIENNNLPNVFVAKIKQTVTEAHRLIFIGDSLQRHVVHAAVRQRISSADNEICGLLKDIVSTTKAAAIHYPSVLRTQDMVNKVVQLSQSAKRLQAFIKELCRINVPPSV